MLYGRATELEIGRRALEHARAGRGRVLVISGEPGIGKSALARAILEQAEPNARVAFGRAWEVGGAPPYWPWAQALADLGLDVAELLGSSTGEMAGAQRVVAFQRVTRALVGLGPLAIALDDLHAADTASLELALAVARGIARHPILIVATTRESELLDSPVHAELVAKLAREGERIALRRLDEAATSEWLAAIRFEGNAHEVFRLTEGNPLFVEEAARMGIDRWSAGGVSVMLRQHIDRVSAPVREILAKASVLGREIRREDVAALAGSDLDTVANAEREALRTNILAPAKDGWLFAHVLLRDALYDSLAPSMRAELHARAARIARTPAQIASHLLEAASVLPIDEVVEGVADASRAALQQHAADDALLLIDRTMRTLAGRLDDGLKLTLELVVCEARMRTSTTEGRALAQQCAANAKRLGRPRDLARAALLYGLELQSGLVDPVMVQLLEEALEALPPDETLLRARVLVRLAAAMIPPKDDAGWHLARKRGDEGLALARASNDPATLLYALRFCAAAFGYAVPASQRAHIIEELVSLAKARRDDFTLLNVGFYYACHYFELEQPERAHAEAEAFCKLVEEIPLPQFQWRVPALRASIAALEARWDESHRWSDELKRVATESHVKNGMHAWSLLEIALAVCEGNVERFARFEQEILALHKLMPTFAPWTACTHALMGRFDEARAALESVIRFARGFPWLISAGQCTILLGDRELAAHFYPLLVNESFAGRFFWGPAGIFPLGPTERILGELALLLGRKDEARKHLDEAIAQSKRCGATSLVQVSERSRAKLDDPAPPRSVRRAIAMKREGDVWLVSNGAKSVRVKHAKGLDYLSALLESPGKEHYVLALAGAGESPEDAGAILDERAKAEYRARVEDLEDRIAEAERNGDPGKAERAREELDAIADQLAGALGLGGRDRKAASNVERARINVQRRIKDAIRRIGEHDADLARYLEATIKTGTFCAYEPV